jgi:hypothetical protein
MLPQKNKPKKPQQTHTIQKQSQSKSLYALSAKQSLPKKPPCKSTKYTSTPTTFHMDLETP